MRWKRSANCCQNLWVVLLTWRLLTSPCGLALSH
ncbi:Uncharacterised protein [Vibrio cholerae]|nr:Uncharacterised protein [Vibrio cholerae]